MILIINSKLEIIYGLAKFKEKYKGELYKKILKELNLDNEQNKKTFNKKIYINEIYFNIDVEFILDNINNYQWILNLTELNDKISSIEFVVNSNFIINNFCIKNNKNEIYENTKINKNIFEGQNVKKLNYDIYKYILDNRDNIRVIENNLIFIDNIFINLENIDFIVYMLYNKIDNTIEIKCKNLNELLKEETHKKYELLTTHNKKLFSHIFHEIRNYLNIIYISTDNLNLILNEKMNYLFEFTNNENIIGNSNTLEYYYNEILKSINYIKDSSNTIIDILGDINSLEKKNLNEIKIKKTFFMLDDLFYFCIHTIKNSNNLDNVYFNYNNKIGNLCVEGDYIKLKQIINILIFEIIKSSVYIGSINFIIDNLNLLDQRHIKFIIYNDLGLVEENIIDNELNISNGNIIDELSFVNTIIKMHNGNLNKYNNKFEFNIPLIEHDKNDLQINYELKIDYGINLSNKIRQIVKNEENEENAENEENINITNCKLLLVDDNITIQKIFTKKLKSLKIKNITVASNGLEALEIYKRELDLGNCFDIVLMDQFMPIMDGNEATRKIIQLDPNAVIIGITGNTLIEQKEEFIKNGVKEVYEKPMTQEKVLELLYKYYNNSNSNYNYNNHESTVL